MLATSLNYTSYLNLDSLNIKNYCSILTIPYKYSYSIQILKCNYLIYYFFK